MPKSLLEKQFDKAESSARKKAQQESERQAREARETWDKANKDFPKLIAKKFAKLAKKVDLELHVPSDYKTEPYGQRYAKFTFRKENYFLLLVSRHVEAWHDPDSGWMGDYWTSDWMIYRGSATTNMRQYQMTLQGGYDSQKDDDISDKVEEALKEFPDYTSRVADQEYRNRGRW